MIYFAGRSCRLPMAPSVDAFADLLFADSCAVTEIPHNRWRPEPFFHPVPGTKGKTYSFAAGVVDSPRSFDPKVFGISPREADFMDPQQRVLLEVVWEALEDACLIPSELAGSNVGVFVGASMTDHGNALSNDPEVADGYLMTGNSLAVISNRISHVFDWHGPSITFDTACSSSLFALEAAQRALNAGEIDVAVVGATNMLLSPNQFIGFAAARMLSPNGLSQAFSENADGYVRGEGAVAFVLRRSDANDEGPLPKSYGQLVHVGVNTSGKTVNIAVPSAEAQFSLLEAAYNDAGISPKDLAFIEAHGTGTAVGDPIEADALGRALGQKRTDPLLIGSVKSNIGHLEPAAGGAGLLKTLIALEHGRLPATLHAETLNPAIPFDELNLEVAQKATELLPVKGLRYAGVSSFGFGGANAHAIVACPQSPEVVDIGAESGPEREVFFTSAFCNDSLAANATVYKDKLFDENGTQNTALFDELLFYRGTNPHRLAIVSEDRSTTLKALEAFKAGQSHPAVIASVSKINNAPPVFLFSGNGAQHAGMSLTAYELDDAYREEYQKINEQWSEIAGWSLIEKLTDPTLADEMANATIAQPLLFADQVAMAEALRVRGIEPAAVLGHSGGEVAAALVSGALPLDQAIKLIHSRSVAQQQLAGRGTMAALQRSEEDALLALADMPDTAISIAAVNSPRSVTLVGPEDEITAFIKTVRKERRWACVRLRVIYPFHSAVQDEIEDNLRGSLPFLKPGPSEFPFISSVKGQVVPGENLDVDYWWRNIRQRVEFQLAVEQAGKLGYRGFFEIGPDPVLTGYARDSLGDLALECSVSFTARKSNTAVANPVVQSVARALTSGFKFDRTKIANRPERAQAQLAPYPWQNQIHSATETETLKRITGRNEDFHPLLGIEAGSSSGVWTNEIDEHLQPVFADHAIAGKPLLPGTTFVELALAAALRSLGTDRVELRDLDITSPVPLMKRAITEIKTTVSAPYTSVRISTRPRFSQDIWRDHAACRIGKLANDPSITENAPLLAKADADKTSNHLYRQAEEIGLTYGRAFQRVSHYRMPDAETVDVVLEDRQIDGYEPGSYAFDPVGADAVLHGLIGLLEHSRFADDMVGFVPIRVGHVVLAQPSATIKSGRIRVKSLGNRSILADISYFDADGALIAKFEKTRFRAARLVQQVNFDTHAFGIDLHPIDPFAGATDLPALSPGLVEGFEAIAAQAPADDAALMLDAIVQQTAYELLSKYQTEAEGGAIALPETAAEPAGAYLGGLLNMLDAAGFAENVDDIWHLVPETGLPAADELVEGLIAERPELAPEIALMARFKSAVPELLANKTAWGTEEVFGRSALENLVQGSVFTARKGALLVDCAVSILNNLPADSVLRVAEITGGAPSVLGRIAERCQMTGIEWCLIDLGTEAGQMAGGVASGLSTPNPEVLALDELGDQDRFDLVISSASILKPGASENDMEHLFDHMAPGSIYIATEQLPRDHLDVIREIDVFAPREQKSAVPAQKAQTADGILFKLETAGAKEAEQFLLSDAFGGGCLVVAGLDPAPAAALTEVEIDDDHHADSTEGAIKDEGGVIASPEHLAPTVLRELVATLTTEGADHGISLEHNDQVDIWRLAPSAEASDLAVLYAPEPSGTDIDADDAQLMARLMYMAEMLKAAPVGLKKLWLVLPNGAGNSAAGDISAAQSALWAFMRTAKNEYPGLDIKCVDTGAAVSDDEAAILLAGLVHSDTDETEIVLNQSGIHALRVRKGSRQPGQEPGLASADYSGLRACLRDDPAGGLDNLSWHLASIQEPEYTEIVVEVEATGLNYRDVMWAMALLPEEALESGFAGPSLGSECAGRVVDKGAGVTDLALGDRVVAFGPGCFSSHITVDQAWTGKLPEGISPAAAATVPVAFFTSYYALDYLARLRKGETVLIHGAAGGIGLAAVQIAQWKGAKIIATAGSDVKRSLLNSLGVDHILDSRSLSFVEDVQRITGGEGVDVVLNSLAGVPMERSLGLMRPFGRFLELGKLDYYTNTSVGLRPLKENITYFAVDVDQLLARQPDLSHELFADMMKLFSDGVFAPLPVREFAGADVIEAFRTMQRSGHVGKIVVSPPDVRSVTTFDDVPPFKPDPAGVQVIVGGAGGLGLALADRLQRQGAEAIALIGRSPQASAEAQVFIDEAAQSGAEIRYISCDIAYRTALDAALADLRAWRPITFVVHSAMVLDDMRIADLTPEVLERTMAAKVAGTRNLDLATRDDPLSQFVVFTSMATLIGNHGQSAYVAANAYLEGVIRQRRAQNLPGLAIGWGAILDVGYLSRDKETANLIKRFGGNVEFSSNQAMRVLAQLIAPGQTLTDDCVIWITPMVWSSTVQALRLLHGPTHHALWRLGQETADAAESDDLREILASQSPKEAETRLVTFLSREIARILRVSESALSPERPVSEYGVDSLMGVELGLAAQQALGDDVPLMTISDTQSMQQIAGKIVAHIHGDTSDSDGATSLIEDIAAQHMSSSSGELKEQGSADDNSAPDSEKGYRVSEAAE